MKCDDLQADLWNYLELRLPATRREQLERHAGSCRKCGELMRTASELSCQDLVGFLDEFLEGRLTAGTRTMFEGHLAICPECVAYVDSYRRTIALSKRAFAEEPPPMPDRLVRAILEAARNNG